MNTENSMIKLQKSLLSNYRINLFVINMITSTKKKAFLYLLSSFVKIDR